MLQSASLSAEMQGSLQTKTVYAPPFFAVRMHSVSCCALSLLPSERMQNRVSPSPSSAEYAARVSGFCGQTARIPSSTSALPALSAIPAAAPAPHSSTQPVLVTSRLASAPNSFLVRSLKCCLDRAHLAEHQFAEKLAVIIARCNRFVFGKTSGKRNSQLRKTAVARTPYKPASRSAY